MGSAFCFEVPAEPAAASIGGKALIDPEYSTICPPPCGGSKYASEHHTSQKNKAGRFPSTAALLLAIGLWMFPDTDADSAHRLQYMHAATRNTVPAKTLPALPARQYSFSTPMLAHLQHVVKSFGYYSWRGTKKNSSLCRLI